MQVSISSVLFLMGSVLAAQSVVHLEWIRQAELRRGVS
jgi:hypothetical protein